MLLKATRPATYWLSPPAIWFHTSTMAMQRAKPMRIRPVMYSGLSERKTTASPNIRTGPITQFWISDRARMRLSLKTCGNSSYFTFARGGYIITMRPMAMGMFVEPTDRLFSHAGNPWNRLPRPMPRPMARKIQTVR
ncbi:hypothetical protein D3C81_1855290 [compost metagenome]